MGNALVANSITPPPAILSFATQHLNQHGGGMETHALAEVAFFAFLHLTNNRECFDLPLTWLKISWSRTSIALVKTRRLHLLPVVCNVSTVHFE